MNLELADAISYTGEEGSASIKVIAESKNNTIWTTQQSMAELFRKNIKTIDKHLNNIFKSEELVKDESSFNLKNSANSRILIIYFDCKKQPYYTTWMNYLIIGRLKCLNTLISIYPKTGTANQLNAQEYCKKSNDFLEIKYVFYILKDLNEQKENYFKKIAEDFEMRMGEKF